MDIRDKRFIPSLTLFPLRPFLEKPHCCHPKLAVRQIVNQQHNPGKYQII